MTELIRVPEKITGIRFVGTLPEKVKVGDNPKKLFHQIAEGWYVRDEATFKETKNPFYQGHLDPVNAQLVLGLDEIAKDYVAHQSLRNPAIENDWGAGNTLGGLYTLTKKDIESRLGNNEVTIGEASHPLEPGILLSHRINKNDLLKEGDKAVCTRHSGDCFFDYQLLAEIAGDLVAVKGMEFGSYAISGKGKPAKLLKIEYTQQRKR